MWGAAPRCGVAFCLRRWEESELSAQKPATSVNGNLIPREMGDIPDVTIEYQQFDKKPLKFTARAHYILVPVIVTDKDGKHVSGLTKDAFQILENGKEQIVASVDEAQTSAVPVQAFQLR